MGGVKNGGSYLGVPGQLSFFLKKDAPTIGGVEGGESVDKQPWSPPSVVNHLPAFIAWVNSINSGWSKRIEYEPFEAYKQQAFGWLDDKRCLTDFDSQGDRREYLYGELERCRHNTLYAANKYHYLQESSLPDGKRKYFAGKKYEHHSVLLFMLDCGYSLLFGKPRQIGSTSVIGIWAINRALFKKNHYVKFIAEQGEKSETIFGQKIKFPFSAAPNFMKPRVCNDANNLLRFGKKNKKGDISGLNSSIEVVAPSRTAINGGSPDVVLIDEIGSIPILTEMMNEGRPSLLWVNPVTEKLEMKRQVVAWGTGTTSKGGGAFESEWNKVFEVWRSSPENAPIVPLFFDWGVRCTREEYDRQKVEYYAGNGPMGDSVSVETSKVMFHQHYPSNPSDMFNSTDKLLMGRDFIDSGLARIRKNREKVFEQRGYFEPIFDTSIKYDSNMDVPFKIVGASWVPVGDMDDRATTSITIHPYKKWENRYYQGTDPISSDTGTSSMASVVWDEQFHTPVAIMNFREANNPKYSFLQSLLMGLYYGVKKEAVEKNAGLSYISYKETHGFWNTMMMNCEFSEYFQSGDGGGIGIDNKGNRAKLIINKMIELFNSYGTNLYHDVVFEQLKTFVCKITKAGNETWGSLDHRYYRDDVLYALVFSYIAANSFNGRFSPVNLEEEEKKEREIHELQYDSSWNLRRVLKRVPA
jgi:hypothetical protein